MNIVVFNLFKWSVRMFLKLGVRISRINIIWDRCIVNLNQYLENLSMTASDRNVLFIRVLRYLKIRVSFWKKVTMFAIPRNLIQFL